MLSQIATIEALVLANLLGSIPFGLVLTRLAGAGDLRAIGSGSIGATNVLRTGHKGLAAATLLLDGGKGAVAVLLAELIQPGFGIWGGMAAFLGHCYPIWLQFRGGKGIATAFGVLIVTAWPVALICGGVWLAAAAFSRISAVGSLSAAAVAPIAAVLLGRIPLAVLFFALALIVLWKHRANIARLRAGTEPRIGRKG